ncbi:MAG: glycosyltransferase family 4 protein [Bacteroidia bacterium]
MKIGFEAKRAFQNFTGLGNYSRTLLTDLQASFPQHQYHLYSPRLTRNERTEPLFAADRFHLHPPSIAFKAWWRSRGMLSDLVRDQIDVFHGLSHELPFGIHQQKIKSVVTIHDLIFYPYPHQYGVWDRQVYHYKFRYACQKADHIIAISESTKRDILQYYQVPSSKVSVIYQACSPIFYQEHSFGERQAVSNRWQLPPDYFLYVGSVIERKNLILILQALKQFSLSGKVPQLVVLGGGGKYYRQMQAKVNEMGLSTHVKWLKDIPFTDFPAIYQNARGLIYPSYYEGFGLPVLEALASSLPVITSTRSSLPEAGGPASIYIEPNRVEDLIDAMRTLLNDPAKRQEMITIGREHAAKFNQAEQSDKLMKVYQNLF